MYKGNEDIDVYIFSQGHVVTYTVNGINVPEFTGDIKALFKLEPFIGLNRSDKAKHGYHFGAMRFYELHPNGKEVQVLEKKGMYIKNYILSLKNIVEGNIIGSIEEFNKQLNKM